MTSQHLRRLMFRWLRYPVFSVKELSLEFDAVASASHASAGVASALARRLGSVVPVTQGVDGDAVLHF